MKNKTRIRKPALHAIACTAMSGISILFLSLPCALRADTWYPPGYTNPPRETIVLGTQDVHTHQAHGFNNDFNPLIQGVRFFQKFISPVDSPRCPMYPTCSAYALQSLRRHGAVVGTFLTVDRLLHETSPEEQNTTLDRFERTRYYDPLDSNDFWLSH